MKLKQSKTVYFNDSEGPLMCDLYGWPFVARFFYLRNTDVAKGDAGYDLQVLPDKVPHLYRWFKCMLDTEKLKKEQAP